MVGLWSSRTSGRYRRPSTENMSAIEELEAASVARADAMKPPQTHPPSVGASSDGAERRPITVMFCDLVGSTSLAAKLDAEDSWLCRPDDTFASA
jgi:class 3 adenylate cyclase